MARRPRAGRLKFLGEPFQKWYSPAVPSSSVVPIYSQYAVGTGVTSTGDLVLSPPAGDLNGKLLITHVSVASSTPSITKPSSVELLVQGSVTSFALYWRIGTSSESTQTYTFGADTNRHGGFITAYECSTGWPTSLVDLLVDSSSGNNSSVGAGVQRYGSLTVTEEYTLGLQHASRNTSTGGATAVTVTAGWATAGSAISNAGTGLVASAQWKMSSPTVAVGIAQSDQTITGNTDNAAQRRLSVTLKGNSARKYAYDASARADSPYSGLPAELVTATGGLALGDSYEVVSSDPTDAIYTAADYGVLSLDFIGSPITLRFIFNDSSTGVDYDYTIEFTPPTIAYNNIEGTCSFSFSASGALQVQNNIAGTCLFTFLPQGSLVIDGGRSLGFAANLDDAYIQPVIFASLAFDSGTIYLHTDLGTITTLGHDWLGVGTLGAVDAIEERDDHSPTGTILRLSGIDVTLLQNALLENYYDRPVTIYLGVRDITSGALVSDPMELFDGLMDQMRVVSGGDTAVIEMVVESEMIDFQRSLMRYFSDSELQKLYPGALGFKYLAQMTNARVVIGSKETINFGSPGGNSISGPTTKKQRRRNR